MMMQQIWTTIISEFSDLSDVTQITKVTLRLLTAAILGGLLGYEREIKGKSAGLRTHMLVALGAAIFIIVPQLAGASQVEVSRVLQGLIAGVGFLGAGAIMIGQQKQNESGLTSAATVWITAAIGVTVGMGYEATAVLSTLITLVILALIPKYRKQNK